MVLKFLSFFPLLLFVSFHLFSFAVSSSFVFPRFVFPLFIFSLWSKHSRFETANIISLILSLVSKRIRKNMSSNGSIVFLVTHGAKEKWKGGTAPSRIGSIWPSTTIRNVLGTLLLQRLSRHTINRRLAVINQKPQYR